VSNSTRRILITGGAGFVGSSLAISLKRKYPHYQVICLDNLKRRGAELNLPRLAAVGIEFIHGDIRSKEDLDAVGQGVTTVIEASAEPSVLAGIDGLPDYLINTNLTGTINCLNFATRHKASFIFLSTSRVYPIEKIESIAYTEDSTRFSIAARQTIRGVSGQGLSEDFPLEGYRSFYGATKLASELLIHEYHHFYGLKTVINRCGVLAGPWQMGKVDQGVMALWVARHFWKKDLSYIGYGGEGKQVRDVLHIDDLFDLVDLQIHNLEKFNGTLHNVGGGLQNSVSLQELTKICERVTGNTIGIQKIREDRKADIRIYITDNSLITATCGWKPARTVEQIVADIRTWISENESSLKPILSL
jgi:CDP-paratose 2-epimerase